MANVEFNDDTIRSDDKPYKFPQGQTSRYCIMDKATVMERCHFDSGFFICTKEKEGHCTWCEVDMDEARPQFANNIFVYNTAQDGSPLNPLSGRLEWISYRDDQFFLYRDMRRQFGDLRQHDIMFTCTEFKYQKGQRMPLPQAWWLMDEKFKAEVASLYQTRGIKDLSKKLGRYITYPRQMEFRNKRAASKGQAPSFNPAAGAAQRVGQAPSFGGGQQSALPYTDVTPSFGKDGMGGNTQPGVPAGGNPLPMDDMPPSQPSTNQPHDLAVNAGHAPMGGVPDLDDLLAQHGR